MGDLFSMLGKEKNCTKQQRDEGTNIDVNVEASERSQDTPPQAAAEPASGFPPATTEVIAEEEEASKVDVAVVSMDIRPDIADVERNVEGDAATPTRFEGGDSTRPKSLEGGDATKPKRLEEEASKLEAAVACMDIRPDIADVEIKVEGDAATPTHFEGGDATKPKKLEEALISNHLVANDATKPKCLEGELCASGGIVKRHTYKGEDYNIHHSNSFGTTACIPDTARVSAKVNEEHDYDGKGYSVFHGGSIEDRVKGIIWHGDKDKIIESLDDDKIMMQYTLLASYKDQERGGDRETETPAEETAIHAEEDRDPPAPIAETEGSDSGTDANRDRVSWTLSGSEASNPLS